MARAVRSPYDEGKEWLDNSRTGAAALAGIAPIHQATVTLNNDQIKALPTTGITVVSAQGANKLIQFLWGNFILNSVAGAYSNINGLVDGAFASSIYFVLDPLDAFVDVSSPVPANGFLDQASLRYAQVIPFQKIDNSTNLTIYSLSTASPTAGVNKELAVAGQNNLLGNFEGGHAANTLIVSVAYYILNTVTGEFE